MVDYREDGGTKVVAEIEVSVEVEDGYGRVLVVSRAQGQHVQADPGVRGVHGHNAHTAGELDSLLRERAIGLRHRRGGTSDWQDGRLLEVRRDHLRQRGIWGDGRIDHLGRTPSKLPVEVAFEAVRLGSGEHEVALWVRGVPRLSARVSVGAERGAVLAIEGRDRFGIAPRPTRELPPPDPQPEDPQPQQQPAAGGPQDPAPPAEPTGPPVTLPEDWAARDLEGRWVWYRADRRRFPSDNQRLEKWAAALGAAKEFELLELIGIYEGWSKVGPVLARADAPQWIRVAVWNIHSYDSHNKENATDLLKLHGGDVLAWFRKYPMAQRGPAARFFEALLEERGWPQIAEDAVKALPPLDARQVLLSYLDAPASLEVFGDRQTGEPGVRYLHQVVRALDGIHVHGRLEPMDVAKVVKLTEHPMLTLRLEAFESLTRLPPAQVPAEAMMVRADAADADAVSRSWAVMVLSFSNHPRARLELARIADAPGHPGWRNAVERLSAVGGPHELHVLTGLLDGDREDRPPEGAAAVVMAAVHALQQALAAEAFAKNQARAFAVLTTAAWAKRHGGAAGLEVFERVDRWLGETLEPGVIKSQLGLVLEDADGLAALGLPEAEHAAMVGALREWRRQIAG